MSMPLSVGFSWLVLVSLLVPRGATGAETSDIGQAAQLCGAEIPIVGAPPRATAARLDCLPDTAGTAQAYLTIPGQIPLRLDGAGGESLLAEHVAFEPASLSVRLLAGPPARYWIHYRHRRNWEPGSANIEHRRDLVVSAAATGQVWLDQWGFASYDFSRNSVFYDVADDLTLVADSPVLRLRARRYRDEHWVEPEMAAFACAEECGAAPTDSSTPAAPTCERECLRRKLDSANQQTSLRVQDHVIAADGKTSSATAWAKQFQPLVFDLAARPEERPLTLLVLDDGAAGWLIVPNKPQELDLSSGFDPAAPTPIPAQAACWLYNRRARVAGDEDRPYPPAPPEALRSGHTAPPGCCEVQSSPDGQRVLIWSGKPEHSGDQPVAGEPPARQLLALYDPMVHQCWSADLAVSGALGRAPYDRMGDPLFSPHGKRLGWRAQREEARFVVVDGEEGPAFHRVSPPVFGPDGRLAYWARNKGKEFVVLDGTSGSGFAAAGLPVFAPTGGSPAWRVWDGKAWRVMVGDRPGPRFDDIGTFRVDPAGRVNDLADLVFSARGELAYAARCGRDWFVVRDQRPGPAWADVGLPVFSPDGARLAYRARRDGRELIVLDGHPGPQFAFVGTPVFSPDGRTLAHWASDGGPEFIVWNTQRGPMVAAPGRMGAPVFADRGGLPWYLVHDDAHTFPSAARILEGDRTVLREVSSMRVVLNCRTAQIARWEQDGALAWVVVGDARSPDYNIDDLSPPALVFSPDGRLLAHAAGREGRQFIRLGAQEGGDFDEVGDPVFSPTGDRLAYRARTGRRWWPIVVPVAALLPDAVTDPLSASVPAAGLPATAALTKVVPRLLPNPVAVSDLAGSNPIVGGAGGGHWYDTSAIADGLGEEALQAQGDNDGCVPVGRDWIEPGLRWRLYGFDRALGECTGAGVSACFAAASGEILVRLALTDCPVRDFRIAVSGPWEALPRQPRALREHDRFVPLVRRVLDARGRAAAPVAIDAVHAIDLDGDGRDEFVVNAAHGSGDTVDSSSADYSLLLLAHNPADPAPAAIRAWWAGPDSDPAETYDVYYADADGDGDMEIFVDWEYSEGGGTRVYTLAGGQSEETPLSWFNGL